MSRNKIKFWYIKKATTYKMTEMWENVWNEYVRELRPLMFKISYEIEKSGERI